MPAYCRFSLWVLIVLPLAAWGTPSLAEDLPQAELVLTQGESGLPRDNVFYTGEKVFATLRVTGLGDQRPYMGQIQVTGIVLDAKGTEVLRVEKEPEYYSQVLGGDSIETTLEIDSDRKGIPPGNYTLVVTVGHSPSGRTWKSRRDFVWKEVTSFCSGEFCWFLDSEQKYPVGPVFHPGRQYAFRSRVMGYSFEGRKPDVQCQLRLVSNDDHKTIGATAKGTLPLSFPPDEVHPSQAWGGIFAKFGGAGRFLIMQDLIDVPSGRTSSMSTPVIVSGTEVLRDRDGHGMKPFFYLCHGPLGAVRKSAYLAGEDIWAVAGFLDDTQGGLSTQNMETHCLDETGEVVDVDRFGARVTLSSFTERFFVGGLQVEVVPELGPFERIRTIEFHLTQTETGKETILSTPIRILPLTGLAAMNLRFSRDSNNKVPAGALLTAGQTCYLQSDVVNFTIRNYAIDLTHSVKAFTEDGQPIVGTELFLEHKRELSVSEKLQGKLPLTMQISLNRPGKFLLRSTITDNLSGQTYTSDMPVEVVSPFQFVGRR